MIITYTYTYGNQMVEIDYTGDAFLLPDDIQVVYDVIKTEFDADCACQNQLPVMEQGPSAITKRDSNQWNFPRARPPPLKFLGNMERFWIEGFMWTFLDIFSKYSDVWMLVPVFEVPAELGAEARKETVFNAKVRFICNCGNMWSSMKGKAVFWFSQIPGGSAGEVKVFFYGQKCKVCLSEEPQEAIWYYEEITAALQEIRRRVGITYYWEDPLSPAWAKPRRRKGFPRYRHDSSMCEACSAGVCKSSIKSSKPAV